jgi:hypothetical protein
MTDIETKVSALVNGVAFVKNGKAIPADDVYLTKPDPLVDVVARLGWGSDYVPVVRATLDFFDLEIREKGQ